MMEWSDIQKELESASAMSCKPLGLSRYSKDHVFDENKSVKWNREQVEKANQRYDAEVARLNAEKNKRMNAAYNAIYARIQEDVGHGLSLYSAQAIWGYAEDRGHSYGFYATIAYLDDLMDLVSRILKKEEWCREHKSDSEAK